MSRASWGSQKPILSTLWYSIKPIGQKKRDKREKHKQSSLEKKSGKKGRSQSGCSLVSNVCRFNIDPLTKPNQNHWTELHMRNLQSRANTFPPPPPPPSTSTKPTRHERMVTDPDRWGCCCFICCNWSAAPSFHRPGLTSYAAAVAHFGASAQNAATFK